MDKNSNEEEDTHFLKMGVGFIELILKIMKKRSGNDLSIGYLIVARRWVRWVGKCFILF